MNIYRAGGVENDERGAWRDLVASQGSGRAGWLVDNFQPHQARAAKPKKTADTDEILVIPTTTALTAAEATAISALLAGRLACRRRRREAASRSHRARWSSWVPHAPTN